MVNSMAKSLNSFSTKQFIEVGGIKYTYYNIQDAQKKMGVDLSRLPFSLKVLFENLLRYEDNISVTKADIENFCSWIKDKKSNQEIAYRPARVLMQDFTGVPAVVDLAAMRDAMSSLGGDTSA